MLRLISLALVTISLVSGCGVFSGATLTRPVSEGAGEYVGSFSGNDQGIMSGVMLADGTVIGSVFSALAGNVFLQGLAEADGDFLGVASTGATFRGQLTNDCTINGDWSNGFFSGRWTASLLQQ